MRGRGKDMGGIVPKNGADGLRVLHLAPKAKEVTHVGRKYVSLHVTWK